MKTGDYAAIVLAAGFSSRMDTFKPTLPLNGETITEHVITTFLQNDVAVYLVVGFRHDEVRAATRKWNINILENPDYEHGMFTSVQAGVRQLRPHHKRFFVMPVDIPLVRPATIGRLMNEAEQHPDKVIYPVFGKMRGHPPLIPSTLIPSIVGWEKEGGLKAVLATQADNALEVTVPDENILLDIDTPEDYKALLVRFQRYDVPTDAECEVIMNNICDVPLNIRKHCAKVAEVAVLIGQALNKAGHKADVRMIRAAAMLHDLAKEQPQHDATGGRMLRDMGFGMVGDIVSTHTDLQENSDSVSLESKVVYLADKFVKGVNLVTIEERFDSASREFGVTAEIKAKIEQRKSRALMVKRELELKLGYPLEKVIAIS